MRRGAIIALVLSLVVVASAGAAEPPFTTTINGKVPPLTPTYAAKSVVVSRGDNGNGTETIVERTTRRAGTRAPIHSHDHGGTTCVLRGRMTLYMEGHRPATKRAGRCYFMPPGHMMTGVNAGRVTAVMLDIFTVPLGTSTWNVHEPGFDAHGR